MLVIFSKKADDYTTGIKRLKNTETLVGRRQWYQLNMIDSIGYGIHKSIRAEQRFFPYQIIQNKKEEVVLEIYGHTINENYSNYYREER